MNDPYKVLGVSPDASDEEVKKAYFALARKYHPDKYTDSDLADLAAEKMKEVNAAYDAIQQMRARGSTAGSDQGYSGGQSGGGAYSGSGTGNSDYAYIRRLINAGDIVNAERMLEQIEPSERNAEWNFLMGCVQIRYRRYADAGRYFDAACREDPYNTEYRMAQDSLRRQSEDYGGGYRTVRQRSCGCSCCDTCCALLCADCFCDCCCDSGCDPLPGC